MTKEVSTKVFELPLTDIRVLWGNPTYVYTTPSAKQTGYVYRVVKSDLLFVTEGAPGLMAFAHNDGLVITSSGVSGVHSSFVSLTNSTPQNLPFIPEKCVSLTTFVLCAVPSNMTASQSFPDDWYKGTVSYSDILWSTDTSNNTSVVLSNFLQESGREIDVSSIGIDSDALRAYFINKNDNTLWLFDVTLSNTPPPDTRSGEGGM
jgi:hypothetical protein